MGLDYSFRGLKHYHHGRWHAGWHCAGERAEALHFDLHEARKNCVGLLRSQSLPPQWPTFSGKGTPFLTRPCLLIVYFLWAKNSNTWVFGGHTFSNHHSYLINALYSTLSSFHEKFPQSEVNTHSWLGILWLCLRPHSPFLSALYFITAMIL